jgi:hypothetical protein
VLHLQGCPALTDVNALAALSELDSLSVSECGVANLDALGSLRRLNHLRLFRNPSLEQGPSFPRLASAGSFRIVANPSLVSLGDFAALGFVELLLVEGNPRLAVLGLSGLQSGSTIIVRGNAALPESELEVLRTASDVADRRIVSNAAGPERLDPCPWALDAVCDEVFEACATGTDASDCSGSELPAWGSAGSLSQ